MSAGRLLAKEKQESRRIRSDTLASEHAKCCGPKWCDEAQMSTRLLSNDAAAAAADGADDDDDDDYGPSYRATHNGAPGQAFV